MSTTDVQRFTTLHPRSHLVNVMDEMNKVKKEADLLRREHASMQSEIAGLTRSRDANAEELAKTEKVGCAHRGLAWFGPMVSRLHTSGSEAIGHGD